MPEGPEAHSMAVELNTRLSNVELRIGTFCNNTHAGTKALRGFDKLRLPLKLLTVAARGKKVIFQLQSVDNVISFLITSLGMSGCWSLDGAGSQIKYAVLNFQYLNPSTNQTGLLTFCDQRHFGILEYVTTPSEYQNIFNRQGPDWLLDTITIETFVNKVRSVRTQPIGLFLLEQLYFAGVGNYLRAEILYYARINPWTETSQLTNDQLVRIHHWIPRIMYWSFQSKGHTEANYFTPSGEIGKFKCVVYNQPIDPNGYPVLAQKMGKGSASRTIHWVPEIQK